MANIHFFLTGKGGSGKSFSCTMLAQYITSTGRDKPVCIDTDPVNSTFSAYKAFNAQRIDVLDGDNIDPMKFDQIMDRIAVAQENDTVIVDNGASSFIAFSKYITSMSVPDLLEGMGHTLYVNTVVTGGDAMSDTVKGYFAIACHFPRSARIVVWLNPYFGPIEIDGKSFEEFGAYRETKDKVFGLIRLPVLQRETFGVNLARMLTDRLTFTEALAGDAYKMMDKQRLKITQKKIFNAIAACPEL